MKYFYLWGQLFVLPFTIFFYLKNDKSVRLKILISGVGFGIMALCFGYIYYDYWKPYYLIPDIHIEDFLYGLLFGGMLTSVSNFFNKTKELGKININFKLIFSYILIVVLSFLIFTKILDINHIYILCLVPLVIGFISTIKIKGKIKEVLLTSFVGLGITVLVYSLIILIYPETIKNHFLLENVSGLILLNIPIEEWLFALCLGVGATHTYEAVFNLKTTNK